VKVGLKWLRRLLRRVLENTVLKLLVPEKEWNLLIN
jgi:hypothetical protein